MLWYLERTLENVFYKIGKFVGKRPFVTIVASLGIAAAISYGFSLLENEARPEKQWVPKGAIALEHKEYVDEQWPGAQRFSSYIATCRVDNEKYPVGSQKEEEEKKKCNMLDAKYIKRLKEIDDKIQNFVVDGDKIVSNANEKFNGGERPWTVYAGNWTFNGIDSWYEDSTAQAKCFKFGSFCGKSSILDVFESSNTDVDFEGLNDGDVIMAVQKFENQSLGEIETLASSGPDGPLRDSESKVSGASFLFGYYVLKSDEILFNGESIDLLGDEWEKEALCILGIDADSEDDKSCPKDDLIDFTAQFTRSLSDEFGAAIEGDIPSLGTTYMIIIAYLVLNLSKFDHKYSMIAMSFIEVLIIGLSYLSAMGLGGYIGLPNNQLNLNIPFLLAGLGVDDAFIIASEFNFNRLQHPDMEIGELIALTAKTGGISVLITSLTDALAFFIGSLTVLPALSWFCVFAGFGIVFCFLFNITIFLPALALNARRIDADRLDCLCFLKRGCLDIFCCKDGKEWRTDHANAPNGCCCCFYSTKCGRITSTKHEENMKRLNAAKKGSDTQETTLLIAELSNGFLGRAMKKFGCFITSRYGTIFTFILFGSLFGFGVTGATKIYKDFKLEWFIPDDSYVNTFFRYNDQYFASGTPCTIYVYDTNFYEKQAEMIDLNKYIYNSKYFDQDAGYTDWYSSFSAYNPSSLTTDEEDFFNALYKWMNSINGARFSSNVRWNDSRCDGGSAIIQNNSTNCDPTKGIKEARWQATLALEETSTGQGRYDTLTTVRGDIKNVFGEDAEAFPYSFNFLYWEEVGIIDSELFRNLLLCGGVISVIIALLIPSVRISLIVIVNIVIAIIEILGCLYWWGVTISGVSTIYILICVGLCVDYSVHIAHIFVISHGTAKERSIGALTRIGPSTLNALVSTFLAVVVLSFSKSFIFRTFFKALCLVVLVGGGHGIFLLPVVLSLLGGEKKANAITT